MNNDETTKNTDGIMPDKDNYDNSANRPPRRKKSEIVLNLFDIAEVVVFAVVIAITMLTLIVRTGFVEGDSMLETMHPNDRYILSNLFYTPEQNDIIVFAPDEKQQKSSEERLWVKRVIATEGQKVFVNPEDNCVYIDDVKYEEPYLKDANGNQKITEIRKSDLQENPVTVPEGYIYVLGDNRPISSDSRYIGCVDKRRVIGRVLFRVFPFNKIGAVK